MQRYMREKQVLSSVPIARSTLWRWVKAGRFPKPIRLSAGVTVWRGEEVDAFVSGERHD